MDCKLELIFLAYCVSFSACWPIEKEAEKIIIQTEGGFQTPLKLTEKWDDWKTWEAPEKITKLAPYYKSGYDYDGLPIITLQYGKWDYQELSQLKPDEVKDFLRHHEQLIRRAQTEGTANNNTGIVLICDWDGYTLEHYASSQALELALKSFTSINWLNDAISYGFQINTNFAARTFNNMARPFLGNVLDKFEIFGGRREKWKPALLRKIPSSQLPPEYGGDKDWKPVPWNKVPYWHEYADVASVVQNYPEQS